MNIVIKDLDKRAHREVFNTIGNYGTVLNNDDKNDMVDVLLNEPVFIKTHFDSVTLDLAGKLAIIDKDEFDVIEVY